MPWSTRQLAELTGTTVKTIRYYHQIGLLDEPERTTNNYKQYTVLHLLRLLQIRRLADLGLPLDKIATIEPADGQPDEAIRVLDLELEATIERLQRIRGELACIMRHRTPVDVPEGFAAVGDRLSAADRALITVLSRVLDEDALREIREIAGRRDPIDDELDALADDADDATIEQLAQRLSAQIIAERAGNPALANLAAHAPSERSLAMAAIGETLVSVYRPAQLRVLIRAGKLSERGDDPA
ncbi:MerR family transcriptional regulator [Dactylosporangium sp. CA-233914]|uniref:MerR family transcriptional regulator n=1 Tax=Dactylosporangium sp. CA-233914 TaxID=3239934 RepID=UPI003D8CE6C7